MTSEKRQRHWAYSCRDSKPGSLDWWTYLAACNVICRQGEEAAHEQRCREIAEYAHEHGCGIWHACWATAPEEKRGLCYCTPCVKSRGEVPVCI